MLFGLLFLIFFWVDREPLERFSLGECGNILALVVAAIMGFDAIRDLRSSVCRSTV